MDSSEIESEDEELSDILKEKGRVGLKFKQVKLSGNNAMESLHTYAINNEVDLIVLSTTHRDAINALFHKSMTKNMALNSKIPLLVLHYDNV